MSTGIEILCSRLTAAGSADSIVIADENGQVLVVFGSHTAASPSVSVGGDSGARSEDLTSDQTDGGGIGVSTVVGSFNVAHQFLTSLWRATAPCRTDEKSAAIPSTSPSATNAVCDAYTKSEWQVTTVSAQFPDFIAVQFNDGKLFITIIGRRQHGHCLGGLQALAVQLRKRPEYLELMECLRK